MTTCSRCGVCPIEDQGLICMAYYKKSRIRIIKSINLETGEITYPDQTEPCSRILDVSKYKTRDMTVEDEVFELKDDKLGFEPEAPEAIKKAIKGNLETEYKFVMLIRKDLPMSPGKLAVQASHATAKAMMRANKDAISQWNRQGIKTIILEVPDAYELVMLDYELDETDLARFLVTDLGITEFGKPEITSMGILGLSDKIDEFTKDYKLFKPNAEFLERYNIEGEHVQDVMDYVTKKRKDN